MSMFRVGIPPPQPLFQEYIIIIIINIDKPNKKSKGGISEVVVVVFQP